MPVVTTKIMIGQGHELAVLGFEDLQAEKFYLAMLFDSDPDGYYISNPFDTDEQAEAFHQELVNSWKGSRQVGTLTVTAAGLRRLKGTPDGH